MSTVKVVQAQGKEVVNKGAGKLAWVMLEHDSSVWRDGVKFINKRRGFLRAAYDELISMDMRKELIACGVEPSAIGNIGIGFKVGTVLPGHIVIQDSLTPIIAADPAFGLRIPQMGDTQEIRTQVREACKAQGVSYEGLGEGGELKPIYRKTFYSPYPEGHPQYQADHIIAVANMEQVKDFIASLNTQDDAVMKAKVARRDELKAIAKAKRTPEQAKELADLIAELD
jgi:hypothetical protein